MSSASTRHRILERARREWPWLLAIAVGAALRGFRLLDQVPVDDEWHSIHRLLRDGYGGIALSFGLVDHCIPFTLYLKLAADTVGVSNVVLRLPSFATGVATLVLCPWWMRRQLGRRGRHVFAWLLAVSPLFVLYSRYTRPYDIAVLLSFLSLVCFERCGRTGERRPAIGYGASAAAAAWFLPSTLPFVAAPLLLLGGATLLGRGVAGPPRWQRLAPPALALAVAAAVLLLPPLLGQPQALLAKLGSNARPDLATVGTAAAFLVGTRSPWIGALVAILAAWGGLVCWRRAPVWTAIALGSSALLGLGVFAASPGYSWLGFVLARYLMPALPIALVFVAAALESVAPARRAAGALAAAALCALLLQTGGVAQALLDTRAWFPARWVAAMEGRVPEAGRVPDFYTQLGSMAPGSLTLVESPWYYSLWNNLQPYYEQVHRQRTLVGFTTGLCSEGHWGEYPAEHGLRLGSFVPLAQPDSLRERGVDYVVFHRNLEAEMARVIDPIDVAYTGQPDVLACVEAYLRWGWPIVYRDESIVVLAAPTG
jgi:hypothetical protein